MPASIALSTTRREAEMSSTPKLLQPRPTTETSMLPSLRFSICVFSVQAPLLVVGLRPDHGAVEMLKQGESISGRGRKPSANAVPHPKCSRFAAAFRPPHKGYDIHTSPIIIVRRAT